MSKALEDALDELLEAARIAPICGDQQLAEKRRSFLAAVSINAAEWRDAFAAFQGAFDTPLARRRDDSDYANDARTRLRAINEAILGAMPIDGRA